MAAQKRSAWSGFIITAGVIFSVPLVAFFATGVYNLFTTDRPGLELGVMLSVATMALLWLTVFGCLWLTSGPSSISSETSRDLDSQLAELHAENEQLREIVKNLSAVLDEIPDRQNTG
ncbi:MAG: hypothetical protein HUJ31_01535 [Pseudomonadales bacterium]|nr:hypothetical protein [Pseudomonadales bacterium]